MRKLTLIFCTVFVLFILCACGSNSLCGKWHSLQEENIVIFDKKGGFELQFWDGDSVKGTYTIEEQEEYDGVIHYTVILRDSEGRRQETKLTTDGNKMTMPNGTYKKQ